MAIGWYKSIKAILKDEPELWLAYLYGQQLETIPHLIKNQTYGGSFLQISKFTYKVIRIWRPFNNYKSNDRIQIFVFAGTANQMNSLGTTVDCLLAKGLKVFSVGSNLHLHSKQRKEKYIPLTINSLDLCKSLFFISLNSPYLYRELKNLHPLATRFWFADFLLVYVYLVYFYRTLSQLQPDFVVTANDHSAPNRCMLAVAHQLGIKTVYLQHASVSTLFPALRVNYAFLDGQFALDIYRECEKNQPNTFRCVPLPEVFLTGQKKSIIKSNKEGDKSIGIALNSLDNINSAISFIDKVSEAGYRVIVRWHPGQSESDINKVHRSLESNSLITFSDPKKELVSDFLFSIGWIVAGNSSIHLEAALAGVQPFYYELTPASIPDYYGYVKNGLAIKVDSIEGIIKLIKDEVNTLNNIEESVCYYSASYKTEWEGREGELVANCLIELYERLEPSIKRFNI